MWLRRLAFLAVNGTIMGYFALSYYANTDHTFHKYRLMKIREGYEAREYRACTSLTFAVKAPSYDEAFRVGKREIESFVESQKDQQTFKLMRPYYIKESNRKHNYVDKDHESLMDSTKTNSKELKPFLVTVPLGFSRKKWAIPSNKFLNIEDSNQQLYYVKTFYGSDNPKRIEKNIQEFREDASKDGVKVNNVIVAEYHDRWVFTPFRKVELLVKDETPRYYY